MTTTFEPTASATLEQLTDLATAHADEALAATRATANSALDALQSGVDQLRHDVPDALDRTAAQIDGWTQLGVERARQARAEVRHQVQATRDHTLGFIQAQPVRAVLIAAASGAAIAAVWGLLARGRRTPG